jgi:DNA-binding transcriptional regulator YdaS (Cro superfamily)
MNTNLALQEAITIAGSQLALAKKARLSQAAIHKLVSGKSKTMSVKTAVLIERATGVDRSKLLTISDDLIPAE